MSIKERIEGFMLEMNVNFEEIEENTWVVEDNLAHVDNIVVKYLDPIVLFRVKTMEVPECNKEKFYKKLLNLNAGDLLHGAYAIEDNNVILIDTLQAENLNLNEFQSTIESIGLALNEHFQILKEYK